MNIFKRLFSKKNQSSSDDVPKGKFEVLNIAHEDGQVILETDWDDEFINYLRQNGYTGNDEQIIQKYLVLLNKQILEDLGELNKDGFV